MNTTTEESDIITPNVNAVALDTTKYWGDAVTDVTGRMFEIYLYDEHRRVHACSFQASYELHWVDIYPENYIEDDTRQADIYNDAVEVDVSYHSTSKIDALKDETFPDHMFYDERVEFYNSVPEDIWRDSVTRMGREKAHAQHMRHSVQAYHEAPVFA